MLSEAFGMTLTRVALGIVLLAHGYIVKIITFTIAGTVGYFESIGFPAIVAYLVSSGKIFDGLALLIGTFTRIAAWLSIPILLGVTWMHLGNNWIFSAEGGGWEFPVLLVILAVSVGLGGAGRCAVDNLAWMKSLVSFRSSTQAITE
jgi:putative oxidoreductase